MADGEPEMFSEDTASEEPVTEEVATAAAIDEDELDRDWEATEAEGQAAKNTREPVEDIDIAALSNVEKQLLFS